MHILSIFWWFCVLMSVHKTPSDLLVITQLGQEWSIMHYVAVPEVPCPLPDQLLLQPGLVVPLVLLQQSPAAS